MKFIYLFILNFFLWGHPKDYDNWYLYYNVEYGWFNPGEAKIKIEERPFTIEEAKKAAEAFVSSATTFIGPVVEIDNQKIGDGRPGKQSLRLREIYINESMKNALHA